MAIGSHVRALFGRHEPLIANLWGPILGDASLRADQVHANAQGYAAFAQALEQALRRQGLLAHR